jgi:hypothetical protein
MQDFVVEALRLMVDFVIYGNQLCDVRCQEVGLQYKIFISVFMVL